VFFIAAAASVGVAGEGGDEIFMHSVKFKYVPASFENYWILNEERELNYNLQINYDFEITPPRYEGFRKIPVYSFAYAWNQLDYIRLQRNRLTFKIEMKAKLLSELLDVNL
jgi:hypothetical protein